MNKRLFIILVLILWACLGWGQIPRAIHYQATLRGNNGLILINQPVDVRLSILKGSSAGPVMYKEIHDAVTSRAGIIDLAIGTGTPLAGDFCLLDWSSGPYYLKSEVDVGGSGNFVVADNSKLASVPYALYAGSMILTDANGQKYTVAVDTLGNIITIPMGGACGDTVTDIRDGQKYPTVQIGSQCWMAKNMNIGTMVNIVDDQTDNGIIEKYCAFNDPARCTQWGGYYKWDEAMNYDTLSGLRGICPAGWHVATDDEWKTLEGTVDSLYGVGDPEWDSTGVRGYNAGRKLKSVDGWYVCMNCQNGTDDYGFTALPAGYIVWHGWTQEIENQARFWTSYGDGKFSRYERILFITGPEIIRWIQGNDNANSVRCIKD
jgi:uncharacterized protein (TIGR02145 family)